MTAKLEWYSEVFVALLKFLRTPNQFLKSYRLPPKATDDLQKNTQLQPWGHMEHDLGR